MWCISSRDETRTVGKVVNEIIFRSAGIGRSMSDLLDITTCKQMTPLPSAGDGEETTPHVLSNKDIRARRGCLLNYLLT